MKYLTLILVFSYATAAPYSLIEDDNGQQYQLVPLGRYRRQSQKTNFNLQSPGIATISHTGNILDDGSHRLDGTGYASKDFSRGGGISPDSYGGRVDYTHIPSRSVVGVSADHARHAGTDVKASGTWNFVQTKNAEVGLTGQYGRHFGTGGSRPDYGVFLGGKLRF